MISLTNFYSTKIQNDRYVPKNMRVFPETITGPLAPHQEWRLLAGPDFLITRSREFVSYSRPIKFVRFDSEHAQRNGKSVNRGVPVLDRGPVSRKTGNLTILKSKSQGK